MKVTIESGYVRMIEDTVEYSRIIILSTSVLHSWQMFEKEKALLKLNGKKKCSVTCVNKEIENKDSNIFLLMFKYCAHTENESVWVQSLETIPNNYLNLPLKLAT